MPLDLLAVIQQADAIRQLQGYLTISEILNLSHDNQIYDPFSLLINSRVQIGRGNIFFPSVQLECHDPGQLVVGNSNTFFSNCRVVADPGLVMIGNGNQFGEGGCIIKANRPGSRIEIGNNGRFTAGVWVLGKTMLGTGSQVIGPRKDERLGLTGIWSSLAVTIQELAAPYNA